MVPAGPFSTRCELRPSRPTRGVSGQDQNLFQFNGRLHWLKLTRQSGPPISHHLLPRRLSWIHGPSTTTSWFEHGEAGTAKMRQIVFVNSKSSVTIETGMPAVVHEGCVERGAALATSRVWAGRLIGFPVAISCSASIASSLAWHNLHKRTSFRPSSSFTFSTSCGDRPFAKSSLWLSPNRRGF